MLPKKLLHHFLTEEMNISKRDLAQYKKKADTFKKSLETHLIDEGIVDETALYTTAAKALEVAFVGLQGKEISKEILNIIPPALAKEHDVIAFEVQKNRIRLATLDPTDVQTIEFIRRKTGLEPEIFLTTPGDIREALRRYHADLEQDINITQLSDEVDVDKKDLKKAAEELPIINIVNSILEHAVFEESSDIHIEPKEKEVTVRYRIDGILRRVMSLPKKVQSGIVARVKILSNLKIDEHMVPQDGRFKIKIQDEKVSFRVSILPVYDGEKIVMRLLHEGQKPLALDELGFLPGPKKIVEAAVQKPHGMVLVTGPTGSGKTTTLYSLLGILNKPDVNISTIEDPIEYHVSGINQSQTKTRVGFTFATGLRAFLRQDPDIIMVGEIRDKETAEVAIHAAMTGHLVLSTLHTNDAPTTLPRLIDMGVAPFLVAFTANIIVAQRLVRKICEHCRQEYMLDRTVAAEIAKIAETKTILTLFKKQGIKLKTKEKKFDSIAFFVGKGCRRCGNTGYKGRIGIYEVLEINDTIKRLINARATAEDIHKESKKMGMITMLEDGLIKAKQGVTTIEEILRVTRA